MSTSWIEISELDSIRANALGERVSPSRRCGPLSVFDYIIDSGGEIVDAGARHNDRIPAAVCFLGDPEELAAIIFAEFHVEMLPFDLQLPRLDEIVHLKKRRSLRWLGSKREADFWAKNAPCEYLVDSLESTTPGRLFGIGNGEVDLLLKRINSRDVDADFVADGVSSVASTPDQPPLGSIESIKIIRQ